MHNFGFLHLVGGAFVRGAKEPSQSHIGIGVFALQDFYASYIP
jgi:hypothetical protein